MKLSGWGCFSTINVATTAPRDAEGVAAAVREGDLIARGNGRAYGDSALNRHNTVQTRFLNRIISFNAETGQLVADAGVLLGDVINAFLPQGWFPHVTPGTKFVTLGGMVAADVHGKNHHGYGSFRHCVEWIDLCQANGQILRCTPDENAELFDWTFGGMGLTGVITRIGLRLMPVESAWIKQETIPAPNLDAAIDRMEASGNATYSVAWIDCLSMGRNLGRSILMLGEHAKIEDLKPWLRKKPFEIKAKAKRSVPFTPPGFMLNGATVRAFNAVYYRQGVRNAGTALVDWDTYFYPLDAILGWNKIYGRKGFMQFQCGLPLETSRAGLKALLRQISFAGAGSFLAVLKRLGPQDGSFSFPMEGYTLALDFPVNAKTTRLMNRLDQITLDHGGRFYLAKDARMSAETLRASDPRVAAFVEARDALGIRGHFKSEQSERLSL